MALVRRPRCPLSGPLSGGMCCKTIFTTRMSNIDSRTSTSTQRRFKNTVHLDSIIARSQRSKEFCNTIGGIADIAGLTTWLDPVANDPNATWHQPGAQAGRPVLIGMVRVDYKELPWKRDVPSFPFGQTGSHCAVGERALKDRPLFSVSHHQH